MFYGRKQESLHSSYDLGWGYGENLPSRESRDLESVVVLCAQEQPPPPPRACLRAVAACWGPHPGMCLSRLFPCSSKLASGEKVDWERLCGRGGWEPQGLRLRQREERRLDWNLSD